MDNGPYIEPKWKTVAITSSQAGFFFLWGILFGIKLGQASENCLDEGGSTCKILLGISLTGGLFYLTVILPMRLYWLHKQSKITKNLVHQQASNHKNSRCKINTKTASKIFDVLFCLLLLTNTFVATHGVLQVAGNFCKDLLYRYFLTKIVLSIILLMICLLIAVRKHIRNSCCPPIARSSHETQNQNEIVLIIPVTGQEEAKRNEIHSAKKYCVCEEVNTMTSPIHLNTDTPADIMMASKLEQEEIDDNKSKIGNESPAFLISESTAKNEDPQEGTSNLFNPDDDKCPGILANEEEKEEKNFSPEREILLEDGNTQIEEERESLAKLKFKEEIDRKTEEMAKLIFSGSAKMSPRAEAKSGGVGKFNATQPSHFKDKLSSHNDSGYLHNKTVPKYKTNEQNRVPLEIKLSDKEERKPRARRREATELVERSASRTKQESPKTTPARNNITLICNPWKANEKAKKRVTFSASPLKKSSFQPEIFQNKSSKTSAQR